MEYLNGLIADIMSWGVDEADNITEDTQYYNKRTLEIPGESAEIQNIYHAGATYEYAKGQEALALANIKKSNTVPVGLILIGTAVLVGTVKLFK